MNENDLNILHHQYVVITPRWLGCMIQYQDLRSNMGCVAQGDDVDVLLNL